MEPVDDEDERLEDMSADDLIVALHLRTHQLAAVLRPRQAKPPRKQAAARPPASPDPDADGG